ncbi:hypothetical protein HMPREF9436_01268 [Faecalibacterium cf. prausnitzii KLE1255]|uniref:Uncharacterized protein n=1 Tax=Faecalibacterium cf. prausnitzii KLE1255 TaxID=748224 RepID=E2ZHX7_9FIRM|nr:hypothetical protein HMPREF9436_01268 [Faecalibacterium cf. prausnitzii KLE1255]
MVRFLRSRAGDAPRRDLKPAPHGTFVTTPYAADPFILYYNIN